jgi:hypothetical protein
VFTQVCVSSERSSRKGSSANLIPVTPERSCFFEVTVGLRDSVLSWLLARVHPQVVARTLPLSPLPLNHGKHTRRARQAMPARWKSQSFTT